MSFNKLDTGNFFVRLKLCIFHNLAKDKEISNMADILKVTGISKDFFCAPTLQELCRLNFKGRNTVSALDNISFTLEKNKILCILGPNGSGKTTLLKIISTLILPDKGKVWINGSSVEKEIKSSVGLLLDEERSLYWRLTGMQNLEFFAALYGLSKIETRARIEELFSLFKIGFANRRFDTYSSGMKRKIAIIRTLLHQPQLLLLDEPTKSLDYNTAEELRQFIKNLTQQGKTVVFTTHNIEEAQKFGSTYLLLHKGKNMGFGNTDNLKKQLGNSAADLAQIYLELTKNV